VDQAEAEQVVLTLLDPEDQETQEDLLHLKEIMVEPALELTD
jgi:hypothetical protein